MIARPRLGAPSRTAKCPSMRRITSRNFSGWPTRKFSRIKQKRDQIRLMDEIQKSVFDTFEVSKSVGVCVGAYAFHTLF